jgi:hypothetical protein
MQIDYMAILGTYYPGVKALCFGDVHVYENIQPEDGSVLPSKVELDAKVVEHAKLQRIQELSDACGAEIVGGFVSDALGEEYVYDAYEVDQINLIGATTGAAPTPAMPSGYVVPYAVRPLGQLGPLPKTYKPHTYAQLREVIADGVTFKLARLTKFNDKRNYITLHCTTLEEVDAVTWTSVEPTP